MRKFIVLPLLVLLAACTERTAVGPDGPDGPAFAKPDKCSDWPTCRKGDGDGGGDTEGEYTVTDLGTLGGSYSAASDINYNGDIVGRSRHANGKLLATLWAAPLKGDEYLATPVGDPAGSDYIASRGRGINESGTVIVGEADPDPLTSKPIRWTSINGGWLMEPLTLPAGAPNGIAYDVNNDRTAVGWTRVTENPTAATFWPATGGAGLLPVDPAGRSVARGINNAGHIVGSYTSGGPRAVLWILNGGTYQPCDLDHGDALYSGADAVSEVMSDEIKILGSRTYEGGAHTIAVWTLDVSNLEDGCPTGNFQDIAGSWGYQPYDINSNGVVVAGGPVLWTAGGELVELPVIKGKRGAAQAINNAGLVVGWGAVDKQKTHAMLWTKTTN